MQQLVAELNARAQKSATFPATLAKVDKWSLHEEHGHISGLNDPSILAQLNDPALRAALRARENLVKSIYPEDNRIDLYDIANAKPALNTTEQARAMENADACVCLCTVDDLKDNQDNPNPADPLGGTSTLSTVLLKSRSFRAFPGKKVCLSGEDRVAFADQPLGSFCSGTLVAPDLVLTAGHCIGNANFPKESVRFIFGFRMQKNGNDITAVTTFPNREIYKAKEIVGRSETGESDWALVRLDRAVVGHHVARVKRFDWNDGNPAKKKIADKTKLYMIGHPIGLPAKYAGGGEVQTNDEKGQFYCNLDAFGGNSGSGVFNTEHELVGVLVRGKTDFVLSDNGQCVRQAVYDVGKGGEGVTRTSEFANKLPAD